jgi:hypothetical protein
VAERKNENEVAFEEALKRASQLSPSDQERLVNEMKTQWLRRAVREGDDSLLQHGSRPATDVLTDLKSRYQQFETESD